MVQLEPVRAAIPSWGEGLSFGSRLFSRHITINDNENRSHYFRLDSLTEAVQRVHRAGESDMRECGQRATVKHVLLDCKLWNAERSELTRALEKKSRGGDMPYLLGGRSGRKDPAGKWISGGGSDISARPGRSEGEG